MLGVRLTGSEYEVVDRAASRPRAGRYSRRRFLGAAGAVVGGALLAGCGADEAGKEPLADADVVEALLRRERELVAAAAIAPAIRDQDRRHAARLVRELAALGRTPPAAQAADDPGDPVARKQETVFAYVDALPRLVDPDLRLLAMRIAASEAEHLAALRLAAGEEPVPDPFAGFTEGTAP